MTENREHGAFPALPAINLKQPATTIPAVCPNPKEETMRDTIIETEAMSRFDNAVDEVAAADHGLSGFILAYGQAGRGKSVAAKRYAKERGGTLVHVWQGWSQTAFMQNLLAAIRGGEDMPRHSGTRCKEQIVRELEDDRRPLFVDEADRLRIDRIEDLRDIHELTGVPVVLIGEESIFGLLAERRRIWSRVINEVEFAPASPAEVALYAMRSTGLDIPMTLASEIARRTEGDFRLIRNMVFQLEKSAKASGSFKVDDGMLETVLSSRPWRRK